MSKFNKTLAIVGILGVFGTSSVLAQDELTKSEVKAQAIEACQAEAKKRYGEDAVHYISNKTKWMKGMGGAMVKMKIKPKSKRSTKYSCVLQKDRVIKFYKA